ncbi:MAG: aspartate aminotransferase family protein [Methanobacteriaceae archaeon]|nr:aspartate aminotransferase family protein [Methanobacteriaceae archaeon]
MNTQEIMDLEKEYMMHTFGRLPIALNNGKGALVWDVEGKEYIDCFAGIAVNNVGHAHPRVAAAISKQAEKLIHCSNIYYTEIQVELARLLCEISSYDKVFFANSGAEVNEGAVKLARKYTGKNDIITMENSFHGRTLSMVAATGQHKYKEGVGILPAGYKHVPFGDSEAVSDAITPNTAAVMVEAIQGEGGVIVPPEGYLKELEEICEENDVLLILDEIQTGFGRTGEMFASELFKIKPHITTIAKALGGGYPIAGILAQEEVADAFKPGDHGTTFGGNPLGCAAAKASVEVIINEKLVEKSKEMGKYLKSNLKELKDENENMLDVRGYGLMLGTEFNHECTDIVNMAANKGLLLNCTAETVLRFLPPLNITKEQITQTLSIFSDILDRISS